MKTSNTSDTITRTEIKSTCPGDFVIVKKKTRLWVMENESWRSNENSEQGLGLVLSRGLIYVRVLYGCRIYDVFCGDLLQFNF